MQAWMRWLDFASPEAWYQCRRPLKAIMDIDDELCLCFHVSKRKVLNYLRIERPQAVSQLSDCGGAGTGCGWCRVYLKRLFNEAITGQPADQPDPTATEYARARGGYIRAGGGTPPPGATPIEPET